MDEPLSHMLEACNSFAERSLERQLEDHEATSRKASSVLGFAGVLIVGLGAIVALQGGFLGIASTTYGLVVGILLVGAALCCLISLKNRAFSTAPALPWLLERLDKDTMDVLLRKTLEARVEAHGRNVAGVKSSQFWVDTAQALLAVAVVMMGIGLIVP